MRIFPHASFKDCHPEVVCVTDIAVPPGEPLGAAYDAEIDWLRERHSQGSILASSCSGAVLLARTGLLEGLDATSRWAYCDVLQRDYPGTRWFPERGLLFAGEGQRILMAGSGIAWHQLGGLRSSVFLYWLNIEVLFVEADVRGLGLGSRLLAEAERRAIEFGATNAKLDTFEWQAPAFYQKHGYEEYARVDDYAPGFFLASMKKSLAR